MSGVLERIRVENDNTLSFGNYEVSEKVKVNNFSHDGNLYDLRSHNKLTRLQKNGSLLIETVPGARVHNLLIAEKKVEFGVEGFDDTQITLELEPGKQYKILIDSTNVGNTSANISGKVSFSAPLNKDIKSIKLEKV